MGLSQDQKVGVWERSSAPLLQMKKPGYSFLQLQASGVSLSCLSSHCLHFPNKWSSFSTLCSHFSFSVGVIWVGFFILFCFVLPGECLTFPRLLFFYYPSLSQLTLFKLLANSILPSPLSLCLLSSLSGLSLQSRVNDSYFPLSSLKSLAQL